MKKVLNNMKERIASRKIEELNEDGFSLIELVVAIGILLVLTVGGLIGYSQLTQNAKKAAVESAAAEVYTAATAFEANGDDPKDAETQYNNSGAGKIHVDVSFGADNCIAVKATHDDGLSASRGCGATGGSGNENTGGNNGGNENGSGDEEEEETPVIPTGQYSYRFNGDLIIYSEADSLKYSVSYEANGEKICSSSERTMDNSGSGDLWGNMNCSGRSDVKADRATDITAIIHIEGQSDIRKKLTTSMIDDGIEDNATWIDDSLSVEFPPDAFYAYI